MWYSNGIIDQWICTNCYGQIFRVRHRITYKRSRIDLTVDPRVGVCNLCRAVMPFDCKRTDIHHLRYNDEYPLRDTLELCIACHLKEGWSDGVYLYNQWGPYQTNRVALTHVPLTRS